MKRESNSIATEEQLKKAASIIRNGGLIVFPTDTLYGIGADPFNEAALASLFATKQRPLEKGIPILIANRSYLTELVIEIPDSVERLIDRFWPGGLTIILKKKSTLPSIISPNEKIAVRQPNNLLSLQLLQLAGGMIATTSANVSGAEPIRSVQEAIVSFGTEIGAVLNGGIIENKLPSTIIDGTTNPPQLIREGVVPFTEIMKEL